MNNERMIHTTSITFPSLLSYQLVVIFQIYRSPLKWEQGKLAKARRG